MSQSFSLTPRGLKTVSCFQTVTVPMAGTTELMELHLHDGVEKVSFQIDNITQALDAFVVEGRVHPEASYFTIANAAGDFSAPSGRVFNVSGAPVSLAAAASARFDLDTSGLYSVRVSASAAADSAVVTIYASGSAGMASSNVTLAGGTVAIDQTTPGTTNAVTASGIGYTSRQDQTRTADTIAYTAGDVIGTAVDATSAIDFINIGPADGHIIITDTDLRIDLTGVTAGMTSFRLHLYSVTPPSAYFDNVPWDLLTGDRASYLGYIDLGTPVDVGGTLFVQTSGINKKLKMGSTTSLFGYLVTIGTYTPASATIYSVRLNAIGV